MFTTSHHLAALAAVGVTSLLVGFRFGRRATTNPTVTRTLVGIPDDDDQAHADGDFNLVKAGNFEQCKMVLCVRTDLKMTNGKIASQCGHATLSCYKALQKVNPGLLRHWEITGQAKVALKCSSEEEMLQLRAKARSLNLCARAVEDAGRTELDVGTLTVLGIGPGPVNLVNQVTGHLRLL